MIRKKELCVEPQIISRHKLWKGLLGILMKWIFGLRELYAMPFFLGGHLSRQTR